MPCGSGGWAKAMEVLSRGSERSPRSWVATGRMEQGGAVWMIACLPGMSRCELAFLGTALRVLLPWTGAADGVRLGGFWFYLHLDLWAWVRDIAMGKARRGDVVAVCNPGTQYYRTQIFSRMGVNGRADA